MSAFRANPDNIVRALTNHGLHFGDTKITRTGIFLGFEKVSPPSLCDSRISDQAQSEPVRNTPTKLLKPRIEPFPTISPTVSFVAIPETHGNHSQSFAAEPISLYIRSEGKQIGELNLPATISTAQLQKVAMTLWRGTLDLPSADTQIGKIRDDRNRIFAHLIPPEPESHPTRVLLHQPESNASPWLTTNVLSARLQDPEELVHVMIWRNLKRYLYKTPTAQRNQFILAITMHSGDYTKIHGPAGVAKRSANRLKWTILDTGHAITSDGVKLHIPTVPWRRLCQCLHASWMEVVTAQVQHRKECAGIATISRHATSKALGSVESPSSEWPRYRLWVATHLKLEKPVGTVVYQPDANYVMKLLVFDILFSNVRPCKMHILAMTEPQLNSKIIIAFGESRWHLIAQVLRS